MIRKKILGAILLATLINTSWADNAQLKKCGIIRAISLDVANDRDSGMSLYKRLQKNDRLTDNLSNPESERFMKLMLDQLTAASYGELNGRPAKEISDAAYAACMTNE